MFELTKPTVTSAEPVFHPTSENWFENQYKGKLYLHVLESDCDRNKNYVPCPRSILQ